MAAATFGSLGILEDVFGVPPKRRLILMLLAAAAGLPWLLLDLTGPMAWKLAFGATVLLWLVAYVNAYNFMDGINGISVAQAVVAGVTWSLIGLMQDEEVLVAAGTVITAASLAFCPFNFPRPWMFLGDTGSYLMGAWLATVTVIGLRVGIAPEAMIAPLVVYLADTGVTLVRRILRGEVWYLAHRDHSYQALVRGGWSHATTTGVVTLFMVACSMLGAVSVRGSTITRAVAAAAIVLVLLVYLALPHAVHRSRAVAGGT